MFPKFIKLIFKWAKVSMFAVSNVLHGGSFYEAYSWAPEKSWRWVFCVEYGFFSGGELILVSGPLSVNVKYSFLLFSLSREIKFNIWNAFYSKMVCTRANTHSHKYKMFFIALRVMLSLAFTARIYDSPHSKRHSWEWTHWFTGSDKWSCYVENNFAHVSVESI